MWAVVRMTSWSARRLAATAAAIPPTAFQTTATTTTTIIQSRGVATRRSIDPPLWQSIPEVAERMPVLTEEIELDEATKQEYRAIYPRTAVTAAYMIDTAKRSLSALDSVAVTPSGAVQHGRYGLLDSQLTSAIPLEYLALLHPAAMGAAALRTITTKNPKRKGTVLIYGAGQAAGMAAAQIGSAAGHAVVAVVGGEHSGNTAFVGSLKGLLQEPGTAVPEEFALTKSAFRELVQGIVTGKDFTSTATPADFVADFKDNFLDYCQAYPDTRPAAVSAEHLEFEYMEKDREHWHANIKAYLEQLPRGAPPIDPAKLDAFFGPASYQAFRDAFWHQTSSVISGDDLPFSPPHLVKEMVEAPEGATAKGQARSVAEFPYSFSILDPPTTNPSAAPVVAGGPVIGAIIVMTPALQVAIEQVASMASSSSISNRRQQATALQFLSTAQRAAYLSANSVAAHAIHAKAPIVIVPINNEMSTDAASSLGLKRDGNVMVVPAPTMPDVHAALHAMDIDDNGRTHLQWFIQLYRANDFPFYADYAIHRASAEVLPGPRQIIVTK